MELFRRDDAVIMFQTRCSLLNLLSDTRDEDLCNQAELKDLLKLSLFLKVDNLISFFNFKNNYLILPDET